MRILDCSLNSERLVTIIIGMFCCDAWVKTYCCDAWVKTYTYYDDRQIARFGLCERLPEVYDRKNKKCDREFVHVNNDSSYLEEPTVLS
jgi:hypothetical protein